MEKGAIYCAYGKKYIEQAAMSARSLAAHNTNIGAALFTNEVDFAKKNYGNDFDYFIELAPDDESEIFLKYLIDNKKLPSLKALIVDRSPFTKTLSIDSDTLIISDISEAFDALGDFDFLACEECSNRFAAVDPDLTQAKAVGLIDTRQKGYFNAGVLFYNSANPDVHEFMKVWRNVLWGRHPGADDPMCTDNDQDALNYMIRRPLEFLPRIRFSGNRLHAESFNCYCRMWMEVWEAGRWSDVKILHTWLTPMIVPLLQSATPDWHVLFDRERSRQHFQTDIYFNYISKFSIGEGGLSVDLKKALYQKISNGVMSLREYMNYLAKSDVYGLTSRAEKMSIKYGVFFSPHEGRHDLSRMIEEELGEKFNENISIIKIGINNIFEGIPGFLGGHFRTGYDLEFLAECFPNAPIHGVSRYAFIGYRGQRITSSVFEYFGNNLSSFYEARGADRPDVVIDSDNSIPIAQRMENFLWSVRNVNANGVIILLGILDEQVDLVKGIVTEAKGSTQIPDCNFTIKHYRNSAVACSVDDTYALIATRKPKLHLQ